MNNNYDQRTSDIAMKITVAAVSNPNFKLDGNFEEKIKNLTELYKAIYNTVKDTD